MDEQTGDVRPQERTDAPDRKPTGELGGHPVNAYETAPREHVPEPGLGGTAESGAGGNREPEAVDDEPGSDL